MNLISDKILNDAHIFLRQVSTDDFDAQEQVETVAQRLAYTHSLPRALAIDIACKAYSEIQAVDIPAYIDTDNSTAFCVCLREQGNPEPIYLSLGSLYARVQERRLAPEAD